MKQYVLNNLISLDQFINTLFGGSPDETISSRLWRNRENIVAHYLIKFIDWIFYLLTDKLNHCLNSLEPIDHSQDDVWK